MKTPGTLVISIDFELMWGMFDKVTIENYGANIRGVHEIIPRTLELFKEYDIHATWATVGMLAYENEESLRANLPNTKPDYARSELSAYTHLNQIPRLTEVFDCYSAPRLIQKIIAAPGQELASHTFSHFYCREDFFGTDGGATAFRSDCAALNATFKQFSVSPTSIIFPRNQWTEEALKIAAEHGITAYRGTEDHPFYRSRTDKAQNNLFIRALRLLDHYFNISGHHTYEIPAATPVMNLPASRFLRPYSTMLAPLEHFRLRRIKRSMTYAAKRGEVFHLWWHPHNFGTNQKQNFYNLTSLLNHYQKLHKKYGMQSKNMRELTTRTTESSA